eukprot:GHVN01029461.1.p1 GENE.GHVN01029461.1~~GHVN01029461.1.p1  ORF type:complete len:194 (+),score=71.07 GHVN01029461.1:44-583(+)
METEEKEDDEISDWNREDNYLYELPTAPSSHSPHSQFKWSGRMNRVLAAHPVKGANIALKTARFNSARKKCEADLAYRYFEALDALWSDPYSTSIAFPILGLSEVDGGGNGDWDPYTAIHVAVTAVSEWLDKYPSNGSWIGRGKRGVVESVRLCVNDEETWWCVEEEMRQLKLEYVGLQ